MTNQGREMDGFDKLELSTETLRELTAGELADVAGGEARAVLQGCRDGDVPLGSTWLPSCD